MLVKNAYLLANFVFFPSLWQLVCNELNVPQVKVAITAVRDVRGLPFLEDCRKQETNLDLFKWLQFCFGFQVLTFLEFSVHIFSVPPPFLSLSIFVCVNIIKSGNFIIYYGLHNFLSQACYPPYLWHL